MMMIGLPVSVIVGLTTMLATQSVSPVEAIPTEIGAAVARVRVIANGPVVQSVDGSEATRAREDGSVKDATVLSDAQVRRWLGDATVRMSTAQGSIVADGRPLEVSIMTMVGTGLSDSGVVDLRRGRWPSSPGELMVSPLLARRGVPTSGEITLTTAAGVSVPGVVVGVATARGTTGTPIDIISADRHLAPPAASDEFLMLGDTPVDWPAVKALNLHGLAVRSADLIRDPDQVSTAERYPAVNSEAVSGDRTGAILLGGLIAAVLLVTMLMAGPAFAVSASRRRRSLALLAATGGTVSQLRRVTLGQGLLLALVAAPAGAMFGISVVGAQGLVEIAMSGVSRRGPLDVNWPLTVAVVGAAILSALAAALLPARGAARLDVVGVLASRTEPRAEGRVPVALWVSAGTILVAVLGASLRWVLDPDSIGSSVGLAVASSITAVLCGILLVGVGPTLLGRVHRLPLTLRLAARDTVRHGSRTRPAMAAIIAVTATMTLLIIAVGSADGQQARTYTPQAPLGRIVLAGDEPAGALDEIHRQHPDWVAEPVSALGEDVAYGSGDSETRAAVQLPQCTAAETLDVSNASCGYGSGPQGVVADPSVSVGQLGASAGQALAGGTVLVADESLITDGRISLVVFSVREGSDPVLGRRVSLPATSIGTEAMGAAVGYLGAQMWMTPETARIAKLPTTTTHWQVRAAHGAISAAEAAAIAERVTAQVTLEEGHQPGPAQSLSWALLAGGLALVLLATLIATALTRAESQPDFATLSAIGAQSSALRRLAGAQAFVVCGLASAQGILTALLPGAAIAAAITRGVSTQDGNRAAAFVVVPGGELGLGALAATSLAGAVAAVTLRGRFVRTRRAD